MKGIQSKWLGNEVCIHVDQCILKRKVVKAVAPVHLSKFFVKVRKEEQVLYKYSAFPFAIQASFSSAELDGTSIIY